MKTLRNLAFLVIVGAALFGRPQTTWAVCDLSLFGYGSCEDLTNGIILETNGFAETCADFCALRPLCNPEVSYCYVRTLICVEEPDNAEYECLCLCVPA